MKTNDLTRLKQTNTIQPEVTLPPESKAEKKEKKMTQHKTDWSKVKIGTPVRVRKNKGEWEDAIFGSDASDGPVAGAFSWLLYYVSGSLDQYLGARVDPETGAIYLDDPDYEMELVETEQEAIQFADGSSATIEQLRKDLDFNKNRFGDSAFCYTAATVEALLNHIQK